LRVSSQETILETITKCLLLPIDGSEESLRPVEFLGRLYPRKDSINIMLCYFLSRLAPIYRERPESEAVARQKRKILQSREEEKRRILDHARKILVHAGFLGDHIWEHSEEKEMTVAHHACRLADMKKVDAVVVQKRTSSSLEGFLKGDGTPSMLQHCLVSPVWIVDDVDDPSRAVVCIMPSETSLRAADHAGFMLAETGTHIDILHATDSISYPVTSPAGELSVELLQWLMMKQGRPMKDYLLKACDLLQKAGVDDSRIRIFLLPSRGSAAKEIISYSRQEKIGIIVLGHTESMGIWSFFQSSVTKKILADFRHMAVWINQ
jgi:nucleotide-binding universal stress UspA family protein